MRHTSRRRSDFEKFASFLDIDNMLLFTRFSVARSKGPLTYLASHTNKDYKIHKKIKYTRNTKIFS